MAGIHDNASAFDQGISVCIEYNRRDLLDTLLNKIYDNRADKWVAMRSRSILEKCIGMTLRWGTELTAKQIIEAIKKMVEPSLLPLHVITEDVASWLWPGALRAFHESGVVKITFDRNLAEAAAKGDSAEIFNYVMDNIPSADLTPGALAILSYIICDAGKTAMMQRLKAAGVKECSGCSHYLSACKTLNENNNRNKKRKLN